MGDFIFDTFQPFHFYVDDVVDYYIPEDGPRDVYVGTLFKVYLYSILMLKTILILLQFYFYELFSFRGSDTLASGIQQRYKSAVVMA